MATDPFETILIESPTWKNGWGGVESKLFWETY